MPGEGRVFDLFRPLPAELSSEGICRLRELDSCRERDLSMAEEDASWSLVVWSSEQCEDGMWEKKKNHGSC